jgi:3-dehydroquinate synthase II
MLVEGEVGGRRVSTLLQNAETILLVNKDGKPVSISRLKPGDEVLGYFEDTGRHFGMKVKETIREK